MRLRLFVFILFLFSLVCLLCGQALADAEDSLYTARERFGVNVAPRFNGQPDFPGTLADYAGADELGFGWYLDWATRRHPQKPNGIEFVQTLHGGTSQALEETIRANPGSLWIVGNEPETRGQGEHTPQEYAHLYHGVYYFIKGIDPQAQVAIGGVVMPSPLRLKWLERCLDYYEATYGEPMPIDVWNIHMQILQEKRHGWGCGIPVGLDEDEGRLYEVVDNCNVGAFRQLIVEFRTWLYEQGERQKPVIISEYGVLMPSSYLPQGDESVLDFMEGTFDYLMTARDPQLGCPADGGRLVQRWAWFSLNFPFYEDTPGGFNGALYDWQNPDQLTIFGEFYRDYVSSVEEAAVPLPISRDTYIDAWAPSEAFGEKGRLKVTADWQGNIRSTLLYFDLSQLPEDARIFEATLQMQVVARTNRQTLAFHVGPATVGWDEDITHKEAELAGLFREKPSVPCMVRTEGALLECDVTEIVRAWCEDGRDNMGFMLDTANAENGGNVTYSFASSEWIEGPQREPHLRLCYITRQPR